jgi:hypothetical protein
MVAGLTTCKCKQDFLAVAHHSKLMYIYLRENLPFIRARDLTKAEQKEYEKAI